MSFLAFCTYPSCRISSVRPKSFLQEKEKDVYLRHAAALHRGDPVEEEPPILNPVSGAPGREHRKQQTRLRGAAASDVRQRGFDLRARVHDFRVAVALAQDAAGDVDEAGPVECIVRRRHFL